MSQSLQIAAQLAAPSATEGKERLEGWLHAAGSVLVGFSGGVDSALLACVALDVLGSQKVLAVIGRSRSYPLVQWERARELARQFGIPLYEVDTDELNDPRYAANPNNRCYFCKTELWHVLAPIARERGYAVVVDGTNADDTRGHRPGMQAAKEQGVRSPLAECGLTKAQIRELSRLRGLPTWNQPASPCLSSRIPYGTEVTAERLLLVERAEEAIRRLGISGDLRVRLHQEYARLEIGGEQLQSWLGREQRRFLHAAVQGAGFAKSALDLEGFRSGSMNHSLHGNSNQDVHQLQKLLSARGITADVELQGSLILISDKGGSEGLQNAGLRGEIVDTAHRCGFAYVGLKLSA